MPILTAQELFFCLKKDPQTARHRCFTTMKIHHLVYQDVVHDYDKIIHSSKPQTSGSGGWFWSIPLLKGIPKYVKNVTVLEV